VFRIIAILRNGNDVIIVFNAVAGLTFRLEQTNELSAPNWEQGSRHAKPDAGK
jgi:hypothetical protein